MVEIWRLTEIIETKDKKLDKNNVADEKTLLFRLKQTQRFFEVTRDKTLARIKESGTSKQTEDFKRQAEKIQDKHMTRLSELETELIKLWENENQAYIKLIERAENHLLQFEWETSQIYIWNQFENKDQLLDLQWIEENIYNFLEINKDTYKNGLWWQLIKWIVDELIIWNSELVEAIYESDGQVLIQMVEHIFSAEWLKEIAIQLGISVKDLFIWNSYERWRAIGQLWLVSSGWWLALWGWKKVIKSITNIEKWVWKAGIWAWIAVSTIEMTQLMEKVPVKLQPIMNVLFRIGKIDALFVLWRYFEKEWLELINKYRKAFELNDSLLNGEKYAYMSSSATYMLLREYKTIPADLDIALSPKNMSWFVDNFLSKSNWLWDIKYINFYDVKGKNNIIDLSNVDEIKKVAEEWRLRIQYFIWNLEVELFPEIDGKWLTNLDLMDKKVVSHKVDRLDGKWKVDIPSLDNLWVAEWYVINFLDEFGNSSLDNLWKSGIKLKDWKRINNMYILLEDMGIIQNPDNLLTFMNQTIVKYQELPNKWAYVENALRIENLIEGKELITQRVKAFNIILNRKKWLNTLWETPRFEVLKENIDSFRKEIWELYLNYKNNKTWLKLEIIKELNKFEDYIDSIITTIDNTNQFPQYYEARNAIIFIDAIKKEL